MKRRLAVLLLLLFIPATLNAGWIKNLFSNDAKDVIGTWKCTKGCISGWSKFIIFHDNGWFERGKIKGYYTYDSDEELSMGSLVVKTPFEMAADFFMDWDKKKFGIVWPQEVEEEFVKIKDTP